MLSFCRRLLLTVSIGRVLEAAKAVVVAVLLEKGKIYEYFLLATSVRSCCLAAVAVSAPMLIGPEDKKLIAQEEKEEKEEEEEEEEEEDMNLNEVEQN